MMQNIGLQEGRKGRRVIQPPGGSSNIFLSDQSSAPDVPMRNHRVHHQHMKSSIFEGENYSNPAKSAQFRIAGEHQSPSPVQQFDEEDNNINDASGNRIISVSQAQPSNSTGCFMEGDSSAPLVQPQYSRQGPYRKQTELSQDSMFKKNSAPSSRPDSTQSLRSAESNNSSEGGARLAALTNKLSQSQRGFNVLTGQLHEEPNQRRSDQSSNHILQEKNPSLSSHERPAAGFVAGGYVNKYIRGQAHDSGPLW